MANLTRAQAQARAALIDVTAYTIDLDLTGGDRSDHTTFESVATITFTCREPGASTFLDLAAARVHSVSLNGRDLDPATVTASRVVLEDLAVDNEVTVRATMA